MDLLELSPPNQKLRKLQKRIAAMPAAERDMLLGLQDRVRVGSFAGLPGVTCPGASECRAHVRVNRLNGKRTLVDGPHAIYRCYAASMAVQFKDTFNQWDRNTKRLRKCKTPAQFADLIGASIDATKFNVIRWGVSGDSESAEQSAGLMLAAAELPDRVFYGYTKSLPFFQENAGIKPDNFRLTASLGGRFDRVAHDHGWRTVSVIGHPNQATGPVDVDDLQALRPNFGPSPFGGEHFHLVIHGTQRPDSWGSRALIDLKRGKPGHRALSERTVS